MGGESGDPDRIAVKGFLHVFLFAAVCGRVFDLRIDSFAVSLSLALRQPVWSSAETPGWLVSGPTSIRSASALLSQDVLYGHFSSCDFALPQSMKY